jgi:predicted nucleic-acid-binding protein
MVSWQEEREALLHKRLEREERINFLVQRFHDAIPDKGYSPDEVIAALVIVLKGQYRLKLESQK